MNLKLVGDIKKSNIIKACFEQIWSHSSRNYISTRVYRGSSNLIRLNKMYDNVVRVRIDEKQSKAAISLRCRFDNNVEKEINLSRDLSEELSSTLQRLYANYSKHLQKAGSSKKMKKDETDEQTGIDKLKLNNSPQKDQDQLPLSLHDLEDNQVPLNTTNRDAWRESFSLKLNDQVYKVYLNLPSLKKVSLPKLMLAGMPAICKLDIDSDHTWDVLATHSKFLWYISESEFNQNDLDAEKRNSLKKSKPSSGVNTAALTWNLLEEGVGKKYFILDQKKCLNRFVKVECVPGDGNRNGLAVEAVSTGIVRVSPDLESMPMTQSHKLTRERLSSNKLRVMTYNILANCYADSVLAREELYIYCPSEFLDFKYRRVLLAHEIKNYNADIVFLQECEYDFLDDDLKACMPDYVHLFKAKGEAREGESILFRSDRFRLIDTFNLSISEELKTNPIYEELCKNLSKNEELNTLILGRNTILQVALIESIEDPGQQFLLANTHLFFHPAADFIRLLQAIVSIKHLEKLKYSLESSNKKRISLLFAGDFNSDPGSKAFKYIFTQNVPLDDVKETDKEFLQNCHEDFIHSLSLSTYADFPFTNCIASFESVLDYIFYESDSFNLDRVIPLPSVEKVKEFTALPNQYIPSDHLPVIFELSIKQKA